MFVRACVRACVRAMLLDRADGAHVQGNADKGARHEELVSLLHAQDTAVVQLLLEVCIDRDNSPIKGALELCPRSCACVRSCACTVVPD